MRTREAEHRSDAELRLEFADTRAWQPDSTAYNCDTGEEKR